MTSLTTIGGQGAPRPPQQQGAARRPGSQPGSMATGPSLPPTGLQQQLGSLQQMYSQVGQAGSGIGYNVAQQQFGQAQGMAGQGQLQNQQTGGGTSLQQLSRTLAQSYGLALGRGDMFDAQGNPLMTPDQVANASGGAETMGSAAMKMQFISQAIAQHQNQEAQKKGIAAIQTGLGQVQQRGRGSLASMQTGMYQDLADLYSNQQYEARDFSSFVLKEQQDIQANLQRRQEKMAKRQARMGFVAGVALFASGNYMAGAGMVAGSAGGTGWF